MFDDGDFQSEFAKLLSDVSADSDATLPFATDPHYINALLNNVLQRVGLGASDPCLNKCTTGASRITKRVRDHIGSADKHFWRRSPLWLLIRVAILMVVDRSLGRSSYKPFILFFMCTLARDESNTTLSSDLLHLMSSTILRRLNKLGSSTPDRLSEMALKTWTCLREILDARWKQLNVHRSLFQNPSQDELIRDTQLSLLNSGEYIRNALETRGYTSIRPPFCPNHHRRGTIQDFLSSNGTFFDEAYDADPDATLYDVERSVEEGIDDWVASVENVDDACIQLALLMDKYTSKHFKCTDPERASIWLLTVLDLCVALDKLVVKEVPMLADYPPLIFIRPEDLLLRQTTSLHRLSCAVQYLSSRRSQSRWKLSVLSDEFTKDSFQVRYYDQSPLLQQLKAQIEEDAMIEATVSVRVQHGGFDLTRSRDEYPQRLPHRRLSEGAKLSQSPLPASSLHAKVVVFELRCPASVRIWRSAVPDIRHILNYDYGAPPGYEQGKEKNHLFADARSLQPYLLEHQGPALPLHFQVDLAYFYPDRKCSCFRDRPKLRYVRRVPRSRDFWEFHKTLKYDFQKHCLSCRVLANFVYYADDYTSNEVLSAQTDCPADLSLDEFVAFAHLRSSGSLQWLNILRGLRTRTLNLRHHQVHFLLFYVISQIGFYSKTRTWGWHQELQDPLFCIALLDELESLLMEVGASSMDSVLMNTISLLLTRVLASSPSEDVSERATALLRSVRRKTFSYVQDLSYDLALAPANEQRRNLLVEMAATCRSTFDVDHATLSKLLHCPEDVDALLSCSFFIRALYPACMSYC